MRRGLWILMAALLTTACAGSRPGRARNWDGAVDSGSPGGWVHELGTGDWLVVEGTEVWKALEETTGGPSRHVGFLVGRDYRQRQGGWDFRVYQVTGVDRREVLGHVDAVGKAVRYEPQRGGGYAEVPVGQARLEDSVGAILGVDGRILLERTTERRLAFEALDRSGDGLLKDAELKAAGDRVAAADTNRDGSVTFEEFDALDQL